MKLSLDELKVDSYAVQVSESELAEVKGGTGWVCVDLSLAVVNTIIAGYAAYNSGSGGNNNSNGTNTNTNSGCGGTQSSGGSVPSQTLYGIDSIKNGTIYGIDSMRTR